MSWFFKDSPTSKQDRLSLGSVDIQDDTRYTCECSFNDEIDFLHVFVFTLLRLKQRSLKRDASGLKVLKTLLQEIKSPLNNCKTLNEDKPEVSMPVSSLKENEDHCAKKEKPLPQTTCTPHSSQDNIVDLLFSDSNILDDLSTFSPLSITNTPSPAENKSNNSKNITPSIDRTENAAHTSNIKTPFRHSLGLRKRLLPTSKRNDINISCNIMQTDPAITNPSTINDKPNDDDVDGIDLPDNDQFWTQVAATTIDIDLTLHNDVEDGLPNLDDDTIRQLFEGGDDCIDVCSDSQPKGKYALDV